MLTIVSEDTKPVAPAADPSSPEPAPGPAAPSPASPPPDAAPGDAMLEELAREREAERRNLRRAVVAAVVFHVILLLVTFPEIQSRPLEIRRPATVHVVPQMRFKPPPPKGPQEVPKPKAKRIPIPDPTPDEPEPIEVPEVELPQIDLPPLDDVVFGIPGPPEGIPGIGDGPYQIGGDVTPPEVITKVKPRYTEEARKARIEGIVLLQSVVDARGNVTRVQVVKGLGMGLTESAIESVQQFKYRPATRNGEPVAVYMLMRVNFSLQ